MPDGAEIATLSAPPEPLDILNNTLNASQILGDRRDFVLYDIALLQAFAGDFTAALETARKVTHLRKRVPALSFIAELRAKAGHEGAETILREAAEAASSVNGKHEQWAAFAAIALAKVRIGDLAGALELAQTIHSDDGSFEAAPLQAIASSLLSVGDVSGALKTARLINSSSTRDAAMLQIARAQVESGEFDSALATSRACSVLPAYSGGFENRVEKTVSREIAIAMARAGNLTGALEKARSLSETRDKACALRDIASVRADCGDSQAATTVLEEALKVRVYFSDPIAPFGFNASFVALRVKLGDVEGVTRWARSLSRVDWKASAMRDVGAAQVAVGDLESARQTLKEALQSAAAVHESTRADVIRGIAEVQLKAEDYKTAHASIEEALLALPSYYGGDILAYGAIDKFAELAGELVVKTNGAAASIFQKVIGAANAIVLADASRKFISKVDRADRLRRIARAEASVGLWNAALQLADEQLEPEARIRVCLGVAEGLIERRGVKLTRPH